MRHAEQGAEPFRAHSVPLNLSIQRFNKNFYDAVDRVIPNRQTDQPEQQLDLKGSETEIQNRSTRDLMRGVMSAVKAGQMKPEGVPHERVEQ